MREEAEEKPEPRKWRWADDTWMPQAKNIATFSIGWGLYYTFVHFYVWEWLSTIIVLMLQTGWQIIRAKLPKEGKASKLIDTDGFSYKNLIYGSVGVVLALLLDILVPPHIRGSDEATSEGSESGTDDIDNGDSGIDDFNLMFLNAHNSYRALHGVDPLTFDA